MNKVKRHISIFLCYIFIVVSVLANTSIKALANETPNLEKVTGQIIIKLIDTNNKKYEEIIKSYNGKILGDNGQLILASFEGEDISKVEEQCKLDSNIEYTEVNAAGEKSAAPTDSLVTAQDYLLYSNAMEAWDKVTPEMKKTEVKIAVIDSGIKTTHSEFVGKLLPGKNFLDGSANVEDDNGHGTQVTGIIAANHDGKGIAGIAGLINTKIIPIKVLDKNGNGTTFNVASGIRYAADQGASIINISINGSGYSKVIDDAIQYANKKNVLTVVSAPNNQGSQIDLSTYWPCNTKGVITAGENIKVSYNNIRIGTNGMTTTIGSDGYINVSGNSFSAAIVTGTAALIKAKNANNSMEQLKNVIISSKRTESSNEVDILKAITSESPIVEMVSPIIEENVSSDLNGKILAYRPADVKKIEVFLNNDTNLIKTIDGTGAKAYNFVIPYSELTEGINKLTIKVEDKVGQKYKYDKYYVSKSITNEIGLMVKDKNGKPLENANVKIQSGDSEIKSGLTNANGEFRVNTKYNYDSLNAIISYGDADKQQGKLYFYKAINNGKNLIDLSKESKEITVVGKKVDGISNITNGKLRIENDKNTEYTIPYSGELKLVVNKNNSLNVSLISEEEGYYYYNKQLLGFNTSDRFELKVDDSVAKLDITNVLDNYIGSEEIVLTKANAWEYKIEHFNIKNKCLYATKDKYNINYSVGNINGKESLKYGTMYLDLSVDKNIKLVNPELQLSEIEDKNIKINLMDASFDREIYIAENTPLNVSIIDKNQQTVNLSDYKYTFERGSIKFIDLNNKLTGATATISFNMFGQKFSQKIRFLESNNNITNVTIDYKIPSDMKTLLSKEGMNKCNLHYYVYDKSTKKVVISKLVENNGLEGNISIPSTYTNSDYGISMSIYNGDYSVLYNRTLQKPTNNKLALNSDNGEASKVKLIYTDSNKLKESQISLNDGVQEIASKVNGDLNTNMWCDSGEVSYGISGKSAIINGKDTLLKNSQGININNVVTNKFTIKVPVTQYVESVDIGYKVGEKDSLQTKQNVNNEILVSKDVKISSVNYKVNDFINNIYVDYCFNKLNDDVWNIDLNNICATYLENNKVISTHYGKEVKAKIGTSGFELVRINSEGPDYGNEVNNFTFGNFINESGIVADKVNLNIYNNKISLYDYAFKSGNYKFKFDLFGLSIKDEGMDVKVDTGSDIAIRIMDPNDTTKPLKKGKVMLMNGAEKNIDRNGRVYLPKNSISNLNDITVVVEGDLETLIFSPPSKPLSGDDTVAVTKASLTNKYTIKPSYSNSNIRVAYAKVDVSGNFKNISIIKNLSVDENGCKTIITAAKIDGISVKGDNFVLNAKPILNNECIYNLKDVAKIDVRLESTDSYLKIYSEGIYVDLYKNRIYYVNKGEIKYYKYSNKITYFNKVNLAVGETKIIQFGTNINIVASVKNPSITSTQQVEAKLEILDEYGNSAKVGTIKANIYDGNSSTPLKSVDISCDPISDDKTMTVRFNAGDFLNKMRVEFETEINGNKVKSNKIEYILDLSNYKTIDVFAPNGDPIVSGELLGNKVFKIFNGKVYITKDNTFNNTEKYQVVGKTAKGEKVIYSGLSLSDTTTEIKKYGKLVTVNVGDLKDISLVNIRVYSANSNSFQFQNDDYLNIKSLKYWIDTDYTLEYYLSGKLENYLLAKNISLKDSIVNISTTDLCEPGVVINNKDTKMKSYTIGLINNSGNNTMTFEKNSKLKVTKNMYRYNNVRLYKYDLEHDVGGYLYLESNKEISAKSSKIAVGNELSLKVNCKNILYSSDSLYKTLDVKIVDDFNNEMSYYNYSVDIKSSDGKIVKSIASDNSNQAINIPGGVYDFEISAKNILGETTKVIKSVKVIDSSNASNFKLFTAGQNNYSLTIKDSGNVLLLFKSMVKGATELKSNLKVGEDYTVSCILDQGDITHKYVTVNYQGGDIYYYYINHDISKSISVDIDKNVEYLSITTEEGIKLEKDYKDYSGDSKKITLINGQKYKLEALIKDNGSYYLINQDFVPTEANKTITWNKTNVKSISLNNSFKKGIEVCSGTITSEGTKTTITNADLLKTTTKLFVTPGKYDLSSVVILGASDRAIKYKKAINITTKDTSVELGKNLTYDVKLNKKQFSVGEILTAQIGNVKDGGTAITFLEGVKLSNISIDLLHGNKVIKTFVGSLPKTLRGDICVRVNGTSDTLGNISGKPIIINLSSTGNILEGDINLDGRVDIFDMVYIAKDYNKTSASTTWDPRVNLVATDKVIDIKDIAKVAANIW